MPPTVVLDLHGTRARRGVEIDAFETFLAQFRAALREHYRAQRGELPRRGGRPNVPEASAVAFRLVEFHVGSGIATLEPAVPGDVVGADPRLTNTEPVSTAVLSDLLHALSWGRTLPDPVVDALGEAQRAIGDDGSFGIEMHGLPDRYENQGRVVVDAATIDRLRRSSLDTLDQPITVTGRMHMIEAELPSRRVGIRAQDGVDWIGSYPDQLHQVVTKLVERLVRVTGAGRRTGRGSGRLRIENLELVPEYTQDDLFSVETVPLAKLLADQQIDSPQGIIELVDGEWEDNDESRLFLEAMLGDAPEP